MTPRTTTPAGGAVQGSGEMDLSVSATVPEGLPIQHSVRSEEESASIMFGNERITLEFSDPTTLDQLSDVAAVAAGGLRAAQDANARARTEETVEDAERAGDADDDDRSVAPAGR